MNEHVESVVLDFRHDGWRSGVFKKSEIHCRIGRASFVLGIRTGNS